MARITRQKLAYLRSLIAPLAREARLHNEEEKSVADAKRAERKARQDFERLHAPDPLAAAVDAERRDNNVAAESRRHRKQDGTASDIFLSATQIAASKGVAKPRE